MSDTTASLRRRIDGAGDLQSVVRTMKALAASNIVQYERSAEALADYYRIVQLGLAVCLQEAKPAGPATAAPRHADTRAVGIVVFGSDQGLVGQFNEVIADYALETIAKFRASPQIWTVGERMRTHFEDAGAALTGSFTVPSSVETIAPLVAQILLATEPRDATAELHLLYNRRTISSAYAPVRLRLLPLDDDWRRTLAEQPWPTANLPEVVGQRTTTLRALIREYVFVCLFRACVESLASESASRLAAMERADRNINDVLENLYGAFHRLRQSRIDEELFDVISGYEALSARPGKVRT